MSQPIVDSPDKITPTWLGNVLDCEVTTVETSPIGTGQMADSYRVSYTSGGEHRTVVAKLPPAKLEVRVMGASGYLKELQFYRDIAATVDMRTPACLHRESNDDASEFCLLLEDLAPGEQGNQMAGCTVAQAETAVDNLAGLHGPRWNDKSLLDHDWLAMTDADTANFLELLMQGSGPGFIDRYDDRLSDIDRSVINDFVGVTAAWSLRAPTFGIVHGDYRLDNLLFASDAGGYPVAAVDWQTVGLGSPVRDLGYFLGNSLTIEDRRASEEALVRRYYDAIQAYAGPDNDIDAYDFEQCWLDYRAGHFQGTLVTVLGAMHAERTDRGDEMFMAMISRSSQAIVDLESFSVL